MNTVKRRFHRLVRTQRISRPREAVFAYFADASNLEAITPPSPASERPSESRSRGSRFAGRCNPYRTGDGDDDGKCPRPSFPPVPYGCSTGTARALCLSRREGKDYGNTLIIVVLLFLFGGGGYYWNSRRG
jgi:hypothetical protein